MFCLQRKHLSWIVLNMYFLRRGVVSTLPNPQAGEPPLVSCPRLLIQFIHSYPPYRRPFLHPQPEDAPCRGDRDPHSWAVSTLIDKIYLSLSELFISSSCRSTTFKFIVCFIIIIIKPSARSITVRNTTLC
jgi:hypothetical protein